MSTVMQWVHLMAGVVGLGGMGFLLLVLFPSLRVLNPEQRATFAKAVHGRFRWFSWSAMLLLVLSGLLHNQEAMVLSYYQGLKFLTRRREGPWSALVLEKPDRRG